MSANTVFGSQPDRTRVGDWAYDELRRAIVDLRLQPGEPLREAALAEGLGVSKTPVREALTRLEQEGLVETTSYRGAVASSYSQVDLAEIYELRGLLEGACARRCAESQENDVVAALRRNVEESRVLSKSKDSDGLAKKLTEFDTMLYQQMDNRRLRMMIDNLLAHLTRIAKLTERIPGRLGASVEEHAAVVDAIAAGDPDAAEQAMRKHIRSVLGDQVHEGQSADALRNRRVLDRQLLGIPGAK